MGIVPGRQETRWNNLCVLQAFSSNLCVMRWYAWNANMLHTKDKKSLLNIKSGSVYVLHPRGNTLTPFPSLVFMKDKNQS